MTYPIVFPTYQRPDGLSEFYIRRLLDSIYAQSYQDFEVYMIGDKYSDQEQFDQIAKSYDHRIKAVNLPYARERDKYEDGEKLWGSGGANAMNIGIEMAKRDGHSFICLQNHDDFYYPTYLEEVNRCIEITGADFVFTNGHYTNNTNGQHYNDQEYPFYNLPANEDYFEIYPHCAGVLTLTVCMNFAKMPFLFRDVFEETGNILPSDCDLWERVREYMVSHSLRSVFINKVLASHPDEGYTKRSIKKIKEIKKLILISSHCDSEEKRKVLKTNLMILKETKIPIFLYSSIHIGEDIINLVDFYFFNSNNPLQEDSSNLFWKEELYGEKKIKFFRFWRNNRFAGFSQILRLVQFAKILNYDINYFMLYDLVIDSKILEFIKDKNQESFFSFRATENGKELINDCAAQFFSVAKSNIENLESEFVWEKCLNFNCIEHFLADLSQKINVPINRDFNVEDHIYTFRNWQEDFFDYSPWKEFKIYFSKNIGTTDPQHCFIYDVKQPVEIFVRIDNDIQKISIMEEREFEINPNYQKFEFWRDGKIFDVLDKAEKFPGGGWEFL